MQACSNEYQAAQAQGEQPGGRAEAQKGDALEMNRKAIDYGVLEREVQSNRQIFDSLMQRTKETGISRS